MIGETLMKITTRSFFLILTTLLIISGGVNAAQRLSPPPAPAASLLKPVFFERFFGKKEPVQQAKKNLYVIHDDVTFKENTKLLHVRPYNNPVFEFDIHVPKNWETKDNTRNQSMKMDQSLMGDLFSLHSETISVYSINAVVSVQSLKYEVSAKNWLKDYILTSGYALEGDMIEQDPRRASAYYTSTNDKWPMTTYISAQISGNIVFLTRADVPLAIKEYVGYVQKQLVDTMQVSYPKPESVEDQKPYTLFDSVRFHYPVSWTLEDPDFKDLARLSVGVRNKNSVGSTVGFIGVRAVKRNGSTDIMKEIADLKGYFSNSIGIDIGKFIAAEQHPVSKRFIFSRYEVYAATYKKEGFSDPEVHIAMLGDREWYIFVYLITSKEQDNLPTWGRNLRSLDLVLRSMQ